MYAIRSYYAVKQGAEMDRVVTIVRQELERLAEVDEEVSEPLAYAYISKDGFKALWPCRS